MTNPPDDPDQPMPSNPDAARPDDATMERLRALLRDEPVDDDELARERRLRVALAAADPVEISGVGISGVEVPGTGDVAHADHAPQHGSQVRPATVPVPPARRGAPRRWLVAAAILSILGIGGYLVAAVGTGSNDQSASNDAAMLAEDRSGADDEAVARDTGPQSTGPALAPDAVPTTMPGMNSEATGAQPGAVFDASVVDLGRVEGLAAAVAAAEALVPGDADGAATSRRVPAGPVLRCVDQQRALGFEVIAVATLDGRELVVVRSPAGPLVLDAVSCVRSGP